MNIFTIIVFIGIFISVISKVKNTGTRNEKRNPVSSNQRNLTETHKKARKKQDRQKKKQESKTDLKNGLKVDNPQNSQVEQEIGKQGNVKENISTSQQLEKQKLVDAIIWSEIIGEPRSKKPYFPSKARQMKARR